MADEPGGGQPPPPEPNGPTQPPGAEPGQGPQHQPGEAAEPTPPAPPLASAPPPAAEARVMPSQPVPAGGSSSGWYSGPLPIAGLAPRETIGSAIGRTAVKALTALIILGAGLLLMPFLLFLLLAAIGSAAGAGFDDSQTARNLVAGESGADISLVAVPITGLILGEDRGGGSSLFSPFDLTYGYTIKEELAKLADDDSVDGIILEVDSPGGTIFGSKAIADAVEAYRSETGKPVVAYVSGISASGGVYAMAGADEIYADNGTLVGSIGVIFGPFTTYNDVRAIDGGIFGGGVTTEEGIDVEYLTAGRSKDLGNPYRPMTDEERAVLQEGLDNAYADFVDHVSTNRDIPAAEIEKGLGALIFGEQQAVANGLIDGVANREDAYRLAAEAAGLDTDQNWKVERLETGSPGLASLFARRLAGLEPEDDLSAESGPAPIRTEPLCLGTGTILAYHGDPALLCTGGR